LLLIIGCKNSEKANQYEHKSLRGDSICYYVISESTKIFYPYYLQKYTYYTLGYIVKAYYLKYNISNKKWENEIMIDYNYDKKGNNNILIHCIWNKIKKEWQNISKEILEFNKNNILVRKTQSNWNSSIEEWENTYQEEYFYDSNNLEARCNQFKWSVFDVDWKLIGMNISINKKNKREISLIKNNKKGAWITSTNIQSNLNYKGDICEEIKFDFEGNQWNAIEKKMYFYDTTISTSEICGYDNRSRHKYKLNNTITFSRENNIWIKKLLSKHYYSKLKNTFNNIFENQIK
jgi:hypothetical protein